MATISARRFRMFHKLPKRPNLRFAVVFPFHSQFLDATSLRLVYKDAANFSSCMPPNNEHRLCLGKADNKRPLFTACSHCSHRPTWSLSPRITSSGYHTSTAFTKRQWHFVFCQTHSLSFRSLSLLFIRTKRCALSIFNVQRSLTSRLIRKTYCYTSNSFYAR